MYSVVLYFLSYSEDYRYKELIKFNSKGLINKTWENEVSQEVSGTQIFSFSVLDKADLAIEEFKKASRKVFFNVPILIA